MAWHGTQQTILFRIYAHSSLAHTYTAHTHTPAQHKPLTLQVYICAHEMILRVSFFHSFIQCYFSVLLLLLLPLIHSYLLKLTGFYRSLSLYTFYSCSALVFFVAMLLLLSWLVLCLFFWKFRSLWFRRFWCLCTFIHTIRAHTHTHSSTNSSYNWTKDWVNAVFAHETRKAVSFSNRKSISKWKLKCFFTEWFF